MLNVELIQNETKVTMKMEGRIDASNAAQLQDKLMECVRTYDDIVVDLADLKYISSAGLRAFRNFQLEMRKKKGTVRILHTRPDVMDVFKVTGFARLFDFEES